MSRRSEPATTPWDHHLLSAERWRPFLSSRLPFLQALLSELAAGQLIRRAQHGDLAALKILAESYQVTVGYAAQNKIDSFLANLSDSASITILWEVWQRIRAAQLKAILIRLSQPAAAGSPGYVISHLCLYTEPDLRNSKDEIISPLVDCLHDPDPEISASAYSLASRLANLTAVDCLCTIWTKSRDPVLEEIISRAGYQARKPAAVKILVALKWNRPEIVLHTTPDGVRPLIAACQDGDTAISSLAQACLLNLQDQEAIDELCRLWVETRSPLLENALLKAHYAAQKPDSVQTIIRLKTGRLDDVRRIPPEGLEFLLTARSDSDSTVSANARLVSGELMLQATIDAFCQRIIDRQEPDLIQIAIQSKYSPTSPENCALFFFLSGQFECYEALDFDRRMMRAIYEVAPPDLKSKIARQVPLSGKTDDLAILGGLDLERESSPLNDTEIDLMVRLLTQNQEWERLWRTAFELPFAWAISILKILAQSGWQPTGEDAGIFAQVGKLAQQEIISDRENFANALPFALNRATLRVPGRINALAFTNDLSLLAIGTGERKLALWDFHTASLRRVLGGFSHSISQIAYCGPHLVCGQRSNKNALCSIYAWENDKTYLLGSHVGLVTALIPAGENQVFSAGRDAKAILWDLVEHKAQSQVELPFWTRAAAISPDRRLVALGYESLALASLPDITLHSHSISSAPHTGVRSGLARAIAFTPGGDGIVVGQFNGQVVHYRIKDERHLIRERLITNHRQPVIGLQFVPGHDLLVSCNPGGQIRFSDWPWRGNIENDIATHLLITSLQISQDGSIMATGTRDSRIILWDLRVHDLPALFTSPLAQINPGQAAAITSLVEEKDISAALRNTLQILLALIQHRFQYNIEIEDAPVIRKGEFDIIID